MYVMGTKNFNFLEHDSVNGALSPMLLLSKDLRKETTMKGLLSILILVLLTVSLLVSCSSGGGGGGTE